MFYLNVSKSNEQSSEMAMRTDRCPVFRIILRQSCESNKKFVLTVHLTGITRIFCYFCRLNN